jgi:hypothetical protein
VKCVNAGFWSLGISFLTVVISPGVWGFSNAEVTGAFEIRDISSWCMRPVFVSPSLPGGGVLNSIESRFKLNTRFFFSAALFIFSRSTSYKIYSKVRD